jgi:hypothetical protein
LDNATSSAYADLSSSLLNNDNGDASVVDGDDDVYAGVISAVRVRSVVSSIVRRLQLSAGSDDLDETSRREDDETRLIRAARTVGGTRSRADTLVFGDEEEVVITIAYDVLLLGIVERRTTTPRLP